MKVILVTTTGVAKYSDLLNALNPTILVVEEAAEVLEAHILASLAPTTKQIIQIGDHLQLRPKVSVRLNLLVFERSVDFCDDNSLFLINLSLYSHFSILSLLIAAAE